MEPDAKLPPVEDDLGSTRAGSPEVALYGEFLVAEEVRAFARETRMGEGDVDRIFSLVQGMTPMLASAEDAYFGEKVVVAALILARRGVRAGVEPSVAVFGAAAMLATKLMDDCQYRVAWFAWLCSETRAALEAAEVELLRRLQFRCFISPEEFDAQFSQTIYV
jgi:hypothetical protein